MNILVATDGSENALNAVRFAAKLASSLQVPDAITLISVHDDTALQHAASYVGKDQVDGYLHEQSAKELAPADKLLADAGMPHKHAIVQGHVSEEIIRFADSNAVDLIVMGTKGRSGLSDLLVGSVAQRVLSNASQPVLLVK